MKIPGASVGFVCSGKFTGSKTQPMIYSSVYTSVYITCAYIDGHGRSQHIHSSPTTLSLSFKHSRRGRFGGIFGVRESKIACYFYDCATRELAAENSRWAIKVKRLTNEGYLKYEDSGETSYMKRHQKRTSWRSAMETCKNDGATLLKADSPKKMDFVKNNLVGFNDWLSQVFIWIGLADVDRDGVFQWVDTNATVGYSAWMKGEPDPYRKEQCVVMLRHVGQSLCWRTFNCNSKNIIVCEVRRTRGKQPR